MADSYTATWRRGFRGSAILPADQAQNELEKIRKKNGGELDPQSVVDTAQSNKRNKLRPFFNWSDAEAANLHRVEQARNMIRSIVVVRPEMPDHETREYELTQSKVTPRQQTYTTTEEIMKDPDARGQLLQRALGELLAIQRRYRGLQELAIVFRSIDDVLTTVKV